MTTLEREAYFLQFPATKTMLREKIKEYEGEIRFHNKWLDFYYRGLVAQTTEPSKGVWWWQIWRHKADVAFYEQQAKKARFWAKKPMPGGGLDIAKAKSYPIGDLISTKCTYNTETRAKYLCPIHSEKTASFLWDKQKNKWHCFGLCCSGGDVIDLFMRLNNCDFKTACQSLS